MRAPLHVYHKPLKQPIQIMIQILRLVFFTNSKYQFKLKIVLVANKTLEIWVENTTWSLQRVILVNPARENMCLWHFRELEQKQTCQVI